MPTRTIDIIVGTPINDKTVPVSTDLTVAGVLNLAEVTATGTLQHSGKTLGANQMDKTLEELGFVSGDTLYVIQKMDSASL